jgi:serine/threonine protein phosphatase PrpC
MAGWGLPVHGVQLNWQMCRPSLHVAMSTQAHASQTETQRWFPHAASMVVVQQQMTCYQSACDAADSLASWRAQLVANAGDSRAVLCRGGKAVTLSTDHKPAAPAERARILDAGGAVCHEGRLNGELTVARSIGATWSLTGVAAYCICAASVGWHVR